ncbi:Protein tweety 3 [Liparis tanakae]|uniref:Protein tweety 3 n=1 Tax=Liparis tanakae TaxID=230148 RepID=A0A4Z2HRA0_9TELE|nr:Protein tweety 3 [Liparis tanakae]
MFTSIVCSVPHTWHTKRNEEDSEDESLSHGGRQNHDNLYRVHMPSMYSCGSSYGSEASIPAPAHTVSNAPVTEYMAQNANFQNSRCENTPLIGRESPPPSRFLSSIPSPPESRVSIPEVRRRRRRERSDRVGGERQSRPFMFRCHGYDKHPETLYFARGESPLGGFRIQDGICFHPRSSPSPSSIRDAWMKASTCRAGLRPVCQLPCAGAPRPAADNAACRLAGRLI